MRLAFIVCVVLGTLESGCATARVPRGQASQAVAWASGKKLEECEGECEVDTGRRIGADQIISGEIQKLGTRYKLTLRLHDTHEGRLLASAIGSGSTLEQLDDSASKAAVELFEAR